MFLTGKHACTLLSPEMKKRGHGENVQSIICDVDQSASDQWEFYDWHIAGNWPFVWVLWMGIIKNLSIKTPLLHRPSRAWLQVYYSSSLGERVVILYRKGQPPTNLTVLTHKVPLACIWVSALFVFMITA